MSLWADVLTAYRAPRALMARKCAAPVREPAALALALGAAFFAFLGQWPVLMRAAHFAPDVPLPARLGAALWSNLFLLPLFLYALAAGTHLIALALGGRGSFYTARLALFWAFFAIAPLTLLLGLWRGYAGDFGPVVFAQLAVFATFLWLWGQMLWQAERAPE